MSTSRGFARWLCLVAPFVVVGCVQPGDDAGDDSQPLSPEESPGAEPECADPIVKGGYYVADRASCYVADYACPRGHEDFWNACGCGCVPPSPGCGQTECPDPQRRDVRYLSHDPNLCARSDFACGFNEALFSNHCGCGCVPRARFTPEECRASGGQVVGDFGTGGVHGPDYRCPSGPAPIAGILTAEGEPFGIEGAVCCPL